MRLAPSRPVPLQVHAVSQLSVLEQIVLVAAHRAQQKSKDAINFEMVRGLERAIDEAGPARGSSLTAHSLFAQVHHQLQTYVSRSNHVDSYTRAAAWRAYDSLVEEGMLSYLDARCDVGPEF